MSNPKFKVLYEKLRGKTFEINRDAMSIGRRETMDICIKDSTLSGHHADIIRSQRDGKTVYILRDNDSTNGTKVNNVPITEQELKNSDLILFGAVEVLFDGDDESDGVTTFQPTVTLDLSLDSGVSSAPTLANLNPLAEQEEKKRELSRKIMIAAVVAAGLMVAVGLVFVLIKILNI
jgi:pSer/pThr/pTyr-binding forkhead associated (FHA) protein